MIDQALQLIRDRLNGHLEARFPISDEMISLSPLTDADGKPVADAHNRLVMFLTNIAHDQVPRVRQSGSAVEQSQPIHLDIYFMLASAHAANNYVEGLKQLSSALNFFQANPVFTPQNSPDMPAGLSQLTVEISNLKVEEMGQLWGNLGGNYVPSVMFKMRSIMIDAGAVAGVAPVIRAPERSAQFKRRSS